MCLILHKPVGITVDEDKLYNAWVNNKDGMGIMFKGKNNHVYTHRLMPRSFKDVLKVWERYKQNDIAVHFRFATSGEKSKKMAHPLQVLSNSQDGSDLYLMHNGVLKNTDNRNKKASDTWHFVMDILKPLLKIHGLKLLHDPVFSKILGDYIGTGNKFLFLDGNGVWAFINRASGSDTIIPNCWASNEYSLKTSTYRNNSHASFNLKNSYNNYSDFSDYSDYSYSSNVDDYTGLQEHLQLPKPKTTPYIGLGWKWTNIEKKNNIVTLPAKTIATSPKDLELCASKNDTLQDVHARNEYIYGNQDIVDFLYMTDKAILQWVLDSPEETAVMLVDLLRLAFYYTDDLNSEVNKRKNTNG